MLAVPETVRALAALKGDEMIRWLADKIYEKTGIAVNLGDITYDEEAHRARREERDPQA